MAERKKRADDDSGLGAHTHDPRSSTHPARRKRPFLAERRVERDWRRRLQRRLRRIATDGNVVCPPFDLKVDGKIGPSTREAIRVFQAAYYGPLGVLGVGERYGPRTRTYRAIRWSARNQGLISPHFRLVEFACNDPRNPEVRVLRALIDLLERIRARQGKPVSIVSGFRTKAWNDHVGGATYSQHLYGCAADVDDAEGITIAEATAAGAAGIGYDGSNLQAEHVDRRDAGPHNTTGGKPGAPTKWAYS